MVDGRDVEALCQVFWQAAQVKGKPSAVVAKTFRGRGMSSKCFFPACEYLKHLSAQRKRAGGALDLPSR